MNFTGYQNERLNFKIEYHSELSCKLRIEEPGDNQQCKLTFWTENSKTFCLIESSIVRLTSSSSLNVIKDNEFKVLYQIRNDHILIGYYPTKIGLHTVELKSISNSRLTVKVLVIPSNSSVLVTPLIDLTNLSNENDKIAMYKRIKEKNERNDLISKSLQKNDLKANDSQSNQTGNLRTDFRSTRIVPDNNLIDDNFLDQLKSNENLNEIKYVNDKSVKGLTSYRTMSRLDQIDDLLNLKHNDNHFDQTIKQSTTPNRLLSTNLSLTNLNATATTENCLASCTSIQSKKSNKSVHSSNSKTNSTDPENDFFNFRNYLHSADQTELKIADCMINDSMNFDSSNCFSSNCNSTSSTESIDSLNLISTSALFGNCAKVKSTTARTPIDHDDHQQLYVYHLDDLDKERSKEENYELIIDEIENSKILYQNLLDTIKCEQQFKNSETSLKGDFNLSVENRSLVNRVNRLKSDLNRLSNKMGKKKSVDKTNQDKLATNQDDAKKSSTLIKSDQNDKLKKQSNSTTQLMDKLGQTRYFKKTRSFVKQCDSKLSLNLIKATKATKKDHQSKYSSGSSLNRKIEKRNLSNLNCANENVAGKSDKQRSCLEPLLDGIDPNRKSIENLFSKLCTVGDQLTDLEIATVINKPSTHSTNQPSSSKLSALDPELTNSTYLKRLINNKTNLTKSEANLLNLNSSTELDKLRKESDQTPSDEGGGDQVDGCREKISCRNKIFNKPEQTVKQINQEKINRHREKQQKLTEEIVELSNTLQEFNLEQSKQMKAIREQEKYELENKRGKRRVTPLFLNLEQINQNNIGNNEVDEFFLILKEDKKLNEPAKSTRQEPDFNSMNNRFINQQPTRNDHLVPDRSPFRSPMHPTVSRLRQEDDVDANKIAPVQQLVKRWGNEEVESSVEIKATVDTTDLPIRKNSIRNKRAIFEQTSTPDKENVSRKHLVSSSFRKENVDLNPLSPTASLDSQLKIRSTDRKANKEAKISESVRNKRVEYKPNIVNIDRQTKETIDQTKGCSPTVLNKIKSQFEECSQKLSVFSMHVEKTSAEYNERLNQCKEPSAVVQSIKSPIGSQSVKSPTSSYSVNSQIDNQSIKSPVDNRHSVKSLISSHSVRSQIDNQSIKSLVGSNGNNIKSPTGSYSVRSQIDSQSIKSLVGSQSSQAKMQSKENTPDSMKCKELKSKPVIKSGLLKMKNDNRYNQMRNLKTSTTKENNDKLTDKASENFNDRITDKLANKFINNLTDKPPEKKNARLSIVNNKDYEPANFKLKKIFWESLCKRKA